MCISTVSESDYSRRDTKVQGIHAHARYSEDTRDEANAKISRVQCLEIFPALVYRGNWRLLTVFKGATSLALLLS